MEISTNKAGIITPPFDLDIIKIDLVIGDPTKMALISAHLLKE